MVNSGIPMDEISASVDAYVSLQYVIASFHVFLQGHAIVSRLSDPCGKHTHPENNFVIS